MPDAIYVVGSSLFFGSSTGSHDWKTCPTLAAFARQVKSTAATLFGPGVRLAKQLPPPRNPGDSNVSCRSRNTPLACDHGTAITSPSVLAKGPASPQQTLPLEPHRAALFIHPSVRAAGQQLIEGINKDHRVNCHLNLGFNGITVQVTLWHHRRAGQAVYHYTIFRLVLHPLQACAHPCTRWHLGLPLGLGFI